MKKFSTLLPYALIVFCSYLISCDKDEDTPAATKTELISKSAWKFQSASASGIDVSTHPLLACFIDNTITFSTNLTMVIAEGTVICTPSTAGSFTWSFQSGETQLVLSAPLFPGGSTTFTLVSIDETNLVVSQNVTVAVGSPPVPVVFTFKH